MNDCFSDETYMSVRRNSYSHSRQRGEDIRICPDLQHHWFPSLNPWGTLTLTVLLFQSRLPLSQEGGGLFESQVFSLLKNHSVSLLALPRMKSSYSEQQL